MIFRFARHTNNIEKLITFYSNILGFDELGKFENHDQYNGVFLGKSGLDWHLEFTENHEKIEFNFNDDDILVFYPTSYQEYSKIINTIEKENIQIFQSKNPYWNENGILIKDPDGYNIIISNLKIQK